MLLLDMTFAFLVFIAHAVLFVIAFIFIFFSKGNTFKQKLLQTLFCLLIPIVGPLIALFIHSSDRKSKRAPSDRYIGQSIDESRTDLY